MKIEANNLYLGDCYELIKEIPDKSIDLIYTDIPYAFVGNGVNGGGGCFGPKKRDYYGEFKAVAENSQVSKLAKRKIKNSSDCQEIAYGIDYSILGEFVRVLKKIYVYIWCSKEQVLPLMKYFIEKHHCYHEILVWCKTNPIPATNNTYLSNVEYCLMFREKGTKIGGTYQTKSKYFITPINKEDKNNYLHPTCKNTDMITNHLINSSNENDIVLDPFAGSGSTLIAAKRLNRKYIGFEINEQWYDVASKRLQGENAKGELNLFDLEY